MMLRGVSRHLGIGLVLGLMGLGSLAAHSLSYRLAEPDETARALILETTGHGYVGLMAFVIACAVVAGLGALSIGALARAPMPIGRLSGMLALLPVIGYVVQEHLERFLSSGAFPVEAVVEPTFLIGVGLQLPFALAALWIARALLIAANAIAATRPDAPPLVHWETDSYPVPIARHADLARAALLAAGLGQRGPPLHAR